MSLPPLVALSFIAAFLSVPAIATVDVSAVENIRPALPRIPERDFILTAFGAVGDGHTLNTEAFQKAIHAVDQAGGGRLIVPKGIFRTGPFVLCSNLNLYLENGAMIQAPDTFEALGLPDPATLHSQAEASAIKTPDPLITGRHLHDVAITGSGTIDGSGAHWWAWSERASRAQPGRLVYGRPHLVTINGCERLHIADITLSNSSMFHLVPSNVTDLTIERVKVRAPFNAPNTDAIDPGPVTNAWIHHCDIDTGDDDIVIKNGGHNVLIEDCKITHGHGISIGSGTSAGVNHMLVRRCTFDGADNGIRIKSMRGAGGLVENIRYTEITMKDVANPITIQLNYVDNNRPNFKGDPRKIPEIRNILIDHVTATGARNAGIIVGLPERPIKDLTLEDVSITAETDLVIRDADQPTLIRVTRTIKPGVGPTKIPGEH